MSIKSPTSLNIYDFFLYKKKLRHAQNHVIVKYHVVMQGEKI